MIIETLPVGILAANCYLVAGEGANEALVIDPGGEVDKILSVARKHNVEISAILNTHGHWDHVSGDPALSEATGAEVFIHRDDAAMLGEPMRNLSSIVGAEEFATAPDKEFSDQDSLKVGGLEVKVLHTPGHTPGSSSFLIENNLFCGDLIFLETVGRTDLPGSNQAGLFEAIRTKVLTLPDDTNIFPGHGPRTSVGWERMHNPYLSGSC